MTEQKWDLHVVLWYQFKIGMIMNEAFTILVETLANLKLVPQNSLSIYVGANWEVTTEKHQELSPAGHVLESDQSN